MTLYHHANNRFHRLLSADEHRKPASALKLLGVGMAEIDHDLRRQSRFDEAFFSPQQHVARYSLALYRRAE